MLWPRIGLPIDVELEDISDHGFRIRMDAPLEPDAAIHIGIPGAMVRKARVVRRDDAKYGCEFMLPLSDQKVIWKEMSKEGPVEVPLGKAAVVRLFAVAAVIVLAPWCLIAWAIAELLM